MSEWRKSSWCNGGACVEAQASTAAVRVRDAALERSPVLVFPADEWRAFTERLKREAVGH